VASVRERKAETGNLEGKSQELKGVEGSESQRSAKGAMIATGRDLKSRLPGCGGKNGSQSEVAGEGRKAITVCHGVKNDGAEEGSHRGFARSAKKKKWEKRITGKKLAKG